MTANLHPLTVDAAVKLLTSTMQNPLKTGTCAVRMGVASDCIDQALEACDSVSSKIRFAKSYPELTRAGIRFLTSYRSPEHLMALLNHLLECRCDFGQNGMRRLHKPARDRPDGRVTVQSIVLIFDALKTVTDLIVHNLSELTQHKFRSGIAHNGERRWPQGPEDLLPFGPKDSVIGLEYWVAGPPIGYFLFKLAVSLASFYDSFAKEIFQYPQFTFALARPCQHLQEAIKFYNDGDTSALARKYFFHNPVKTIFQFFDDLSHFDAPTYNTMILVRSVWIKPILVPLGKILSTLPPEWSKIRMHLGYLASYANADVDPKTGVAMLRFERSQFSESIELRDPLEDAFTIITEARKGGCWNIQCSSEAEAVHSRLCSKCHLMRFCGEKCQMEAWKSAPLPHKVICAQIYKVKESLGSSNWSLLWTPDFTYAQFKDICKINGVETEVLKVIAETISAVRIRRSAFLEDLKKAGESQEERLRRAEGEKVRREISRQVEETLGPQVTMLRTRDEGFRSLHPRAYRLGQDIRQETESLDDLD